MEEETAPPPPPLWRVLVWHGHCDCRRGAQALLRAGRVRLGGEVVRAGATPVRKGTEVRVFESDACGGASPIRSSGRILTHGHCHVLMNKPSGTLTHAQTSYQSAGRRSGRCYEQAW